MRTIVSTCLRRTAVLCAAVCGLWLGSAQATPEGFTPPDVPLPAPSPRPSEPPPAAAAAPVWEGALGMNFSYRPEYQGGERSVLKATPAIFLRYGRFSITNASGFVTRRSDEVVRGLGVDMLRSQRVRVNLALRFDAGRSEGASSALAGLGDIKPTVRARLSASWRGDDGWRAGASWSLDAFGRGGGSFGDVAVGWERLVGSRTRLGVGAAISLADKRYMQAYYGVSDAQAVSTGYPVYTPGSGLRDVALSLTGRTDLGEHWMLIGGAGVARLLGPAARSPLTKSPDGWGVNLGLARRF